MMHVTNRSFRGLPIAVVVEPERPRYVLPPDVPPPPGMTRVEFAAWSREVCGIQAPILKDGETLQDGKALYMNAFTYAATKAAFAKQVFK